MQLIECVPNFSEGRDSEVLRQIADAIRSVEGVRLLDMDPGRATNRTVFTMVGAPALVVEAAVRGIKVASELIDMRHHKGEHPRMGACDVCPLIPIAGISMAETAAWAKKLGERVGTELGIPVYLYEAAATRPERQNLATIRAGEYEGFAEKMKDADWAPDFGPTTFNAKSGATVIGARDFLVAYNVNLNTTSERRANSVAFDVREQGRILLDPVTKAQVKDANGNPVRVPGELKSVKGIGWYIAEYGIAQISMNLTNIGITPLHVAFDACCRSAERRGMRVTGSELVGLVPKSVLVDAGRYFLQKQERSTGVGEAELIRIAVKTLGLDELAPFDVRKKVIEYQLEDTTSRPLAAMTTEQFADETASESPAPGGGSVSAYVGALGAALGTMVANLSSHKRGWDDQWSFFGTWAEEGQEIKHHLIRLVDQDTDAFNLIMDAFKLPKGSDEEKKTRSEAIQAATKNAIEVPLKTMRLALKSMNLLEAMAERGNPNSASDVGVGALCARAAVHGAYLNVQINAPGLKDKAYVADALAEGADMIAQVDAAEKKVLDKVRNGY